MDESVWDIIGFGIVAVDDVLVVENYPPPDSKVPVLEKSRHGGGLTGTALVAASRLGAKCAYGGVVGESELSTWTLTELNREGIDCSPVIIIPNSQPYHAIIIVDKTHHTRNIFFSSEGVMPRPIESIDENLIKKSKVIFIDQLGIDSMLKTALIAKELGIPTVADIERDEHPKTRELINDIDHLILSTSFAGKLTGSADPFKQVEILHKGTNRSCTAVTAGVRGCWYISSDQPGKVQHQPAFKVKVVDTTGCGDVFHGAYAACVAWKWQVSECIRFASATAAIKATKTGGRAGIPNKDAVDALLKSYQQ